MMNPNFYSVIAIRWRYILNGQKGCILSRRVVEIAAVP